MEWHLRLHLATDAQVAVGQYLYWTWPPNGANVNNFKETF